VVLRLHADLASFTGRAGTRVVEPGEVELRVGASSTDIRRVLRLQMIGDRRHPGRDRHLEPETFVEPSAATMVP
jgi:beta-glucosidase